MGRYLTWVLYIGVACYALNILIYIYRCKVKAYEHSRQPGERHRRLAAAYAARADWWWLKLPDPETLP